MKVYVPAATYAELRQRITSERRAQIERLVVDAVQGSLGCLTKSEVLAAPSALVKNSLTSALNGVVQTQAKNADEQAYVLSYAKRRFRAYLVKAGILHD